MKHLAPFDRKISYVVVCTYYVERRRTLFAVREVIIPVNLSIAIATANAANMWHIFVAYNTDNVCEDFYAQINTIVQ